MFEEFDANGSGFLDFDEFSRMLPALGIHLPPSKVVRASGSGSGSGWVLVPCITVLVHMRVWCLHVCLLMYTLVLLL